MRAFYLVIACVLLALAVGLAAVGAHMLPDDPALARSWASANQMHFYHALGMFALLLLPIKRGEVLLHLTLLCMLTGLVLFSGLIYLRLYPGFSLIDGVSHLVPVGGGLLILSWLLAAIVVLFNPR